MEEDYIQAFLDYLYHERGYSIATKETYQRVMSQFKTFVTEKKGAFYPAQLGDEEMVSLVRDWMTQQSRQGMKAATLKMHVSCVKSFFKYLCKKKIIANTPLQMVRTPRVGKPLPVWVDTKKMDSLIDDTVFGDDFNGERDKLLIVLLYSTGIRRAEAATLTWVNADVYSHTIKVMGKGSKERIIPFGKELDTLITHYKQRYLKEVGAQPLYLFNDADGAPLSPNKVSRIAHQYLSQFPQLIRQGAHVFRHSFATNMLSEGADLMAVKELLGHASLQSTEIYTHVTSREVMENYKRAHPHVK